MRNPVRLALAALLPFLGIATEGVSPLARHLTRRDPRSQLGHQDMMSAPGHGQGLEVSKVRREVAKVSAEHAIVPGKSRVETLSDR